MKPALRRQLPVQMYNLQLVEMDSDTDSIVVFCGEMVRPTYTPVFDSNDRLVGIFFTMLKNCIFSRRVEDTKSAIKWPRDRLFLDRAKIITYFQTHDVFAELIILNSKSVNLIDPSRDMRPLWMRSDWKVDPALSNVDQWQLAVSERQHLLRLGTAKAAGLNGRDNMAFFGLVLSAVACLVDGTDTDLFFQLGRIDDLVELEADLWLKGPTNFAFDFQVGFAVSISNYPYKSWLTDALVVRVPVPEQLHLLGRSFPPLHNGKTYIGLSSFRFVARRMFILGWKKWAIALFRRLNSAFKNDTDPAFAEFMARSRLWPKIPISTALTVSSPDLILPKISPLAPPCLQKLFSSNGGLKHYARWQLAELAVDMNWQKFTVLNLVKPNLRSEISAAMDGYRRKGTTKNRCQIYMRSTDLCPYSPTTFRACCSDVSDIEDLSPALSFQHKLVQAQATI